MGKYSPQIPPPSPLPPSPRPSIPPPSPLPSPPLPSIPLSPLNSRLISGNVIRGVKVHLVGGGENATTNLEDTRVVAVTAVASRNDILLGKV